MRQMDSKVTELMADRVGFKKEMAAKELSDLNSKMLEAELAEEDKMFPADELYGSIWDNRWVNPYKKENLTLPDSFRIDCSTFVLPVTSEVNVTSKYGPRRRRMHRGIDLKVQIGDTIRAAFDGKVRIKNYERRGYGYYVVVRHPNGLETVYGHLSHFLVDVNDYVKAGDPIALGGNTGRSTGSHLHFETRFLGKDINPADIIDFENGVPHEDLYVFHNVKINGRNSNVYTSSGDQMVYHRVKSGDTLGAIARRYGTTVSQLCKLNGLKRTSVLRLGQAIRCSAGSTTRTASAKNESGNDEKSKVSNSKQKNITVEASSDNNAIYHRIKSGDTLGAIARKYGTSVSKICELNGISKTTTLRLGRSLRCS
ncbi:MAG: peptidoglycan DD-metalloendopeptidase family protein [Macellibacteroides fermentans]|nr:peptidoglycan DD-metalloendopeptidase family protein [Macellibacteroides fermentans]